MNWVRIFWSSPVSRTMGFRLILMRYSSRKLLERESRIKFGAAMCIVHKKLRHRGHRINDPSEQIDEKRVEK